jgi:hypothetical protein
MNRRSRDVKGLVNFPIDQLPSSGEGGMYVLLVAMDPTERNLPVSCGGYVYHVFDETFMGSDRKQRAEFPPFEEGLSREETLSRWRGYEQANKDLESFYYPSIHAPDNKDYSSYERYLSTGYLAAINMGSTGWSSGDWLCSYEDLTEEGKVLYNLVAKIYPGSELHLQTWLDT